MHFKHARIPCFKKRMRRILRYHYQYKGERNPQITFCEVFGFIVCVSICQAKGTGKGSLKIDRDQYSLDKSSYLTGRNRFTSEIVLPSGTDGKAETLRKLAHAIYRDF